MYLQDNAVKLHIAHLSAKFRAYIFYKNNLKKTCYLPKTANFDRTRWATLGVAAFNRTGNVVVVVAADQNYFS